MFSYVTIFENKYSVNLHSHRCDIALEKTEKKKKNSTYVISIFMSTDTKDNI